MADYLIDGVNLDDAQRRWVVLDESSLPEMGAPRLATVEIPGKEGAAALPANGGGVGTVSLTLAVTDRKADGQPSGSRAQLWQNYEMLVTLLKPRSIVQIRMNPGGDASLSRVATARVSNALKPEYQGHITGRSIIKVQVVYEVLTQWTATFDYTFDLTGDGRTYTLYALAGSTGRAAATLIVTNPSATVTVTDINSSGRAVWRRGNTRHQTNPTNFLRLSLTDFEATFVPSATYWTGPGTDATMGLDVPAGGFRLTPTPGTGTYQITLSGAEKGALQARKTYL